MLLPELLLAVLALTEWMSAEHLGTGVTLCDDATASSPVVDEDEGSFICCPPPRIQQDAEKYSEESEVKFRAEWGAYMQRD